MAVRPSTLLVAALCASTFVFALVPQDAQQDLKAEDVYANIQVFKGLPATDIMPAMEFMCASLDWECKDCHDVSDYAKETHAIETTRQMVLLQRDINEKWFNGRLEVTCMTCHRKEEHPENVPLPADVALRHARITNPPKATDLLAKQVEAAGAVPAMLTRKGTMTAPHDETGVVETAAVEFVVAKGGKFLIKSEKRRIVSDGEQVLYGEYLLWGDPVSVFQRIGRAWWGQEPLEGLTGSLVSGRDKVDGKDVLVVRSSRAASRSTEEMYLETTSGQLLRMVNMRPSSIGTVVTKIDYSKYQDVQGTQVPMRVTVVFSNGKTWDFAFDSATKSDTVDDSLFKIEAKPGTPGQVLK